MGRCSICGRSGVTISDVLGFALIALGVGLMRR
jgi:hypothetical protein